MKSYICGNYVRVSKAKAREMFLRGVKVEMYPCKAVPGSLWFPYGYVLDRRAREEYVADEIGMKNCFDSLVNSFEYYNCNSCMGRYASFYVKSVSA